MTTTSGTSVLEQLVERVFGDFAAAMTLPLIRLGDRLGLYRDLGAHGPTTPAELASRCALPEPVVHEWLANQAAAGYVQVDKSGERFGLSPEQAAVFVDEDSGVCLQAAFQLAAAYTRSEPEVSRRLHDGRPVGWGDHDDELFSAVERFYRPAYAAALVPEWIPAMDGIAQRLQQGGAVADVGCGHGISTVLMAKAFPASRFVGIDDHRASIERAQRLAEDEGVADRIDFEVRPASELRGTFDLVTVLDAFHDMGEPEKVAARLCGSVAGGGACLVVEPYAGDGLLDNLTPLGRVYYAASTLACTPSALRQSQEKPLGAQAGPSRLVGALSAGGFGSVRVSQVTPFNLVIEARPSVEA
jgi:SAM-dependent methyltransferase